MKNNENELVEYFIVNSEVQMSPGKLSVQVAHVATKIAIGYPDSNVFYSWYYKDQKKIILKGKEKDLLKLIDQGFEYIRDNGLTEIPNGTLTVVGLPPMTRKEAKQYIKRLQLY